MGGISSKPMNGITAYLQNKDGSLIPQPEPTNDSYSCYNTGGVEVEVAEFLYGLVRMMKPRNVFETGTHKGISASYIAQGLKDNGFGMITTIEIEKQHIQTTNHRWDLLNLHQWAVCDKERSLDYNLEHYFELMFLDSEPDLRFKELVRFYGWLRPGGYVFIHDLPRGMCQGNHNPDHPHIKSWPFGNLPQEIVNWVLDRELTPFSFPTPRGLWGFYKRHPEDYIWN